MQMQKVKSIFFLMVKKLEPLARLHAKTNGEYFVQEYSIKDYLSQNKIKLLCCYGNIFLLIQFAFCLQENTGASKTDPQEYWYLTTKIGLAQLPTR